MRSEHTKLQAGVGLRGGGSRRRGRQRKESTAGGRHDGALRKHGTDLATLPSNCPKSTEWVNRALAAMSTGRSSAESAYTRERAGRHRSFRHALTLCHASQPHVEVVLGVVVVVEAAPPPSPQVGLAIGVAHLERAGEPAVGVGEAGGAGGWHSRAWR